MIAYFQQMAQSVGSPLRVARILLEIKTEREIKKKHKQKQHEQ